jgi:hypothetical protein
MQACRLSLVVGRCGCLCFYCFLHIFFIAADRAEININTKYKIQSKLYDVHCVHYTYNKNSFYTYTKILLMGLSLLVPHYHMHSLTRSV